MLPTLCNLVCALSLSISLQAVEPAGTAGQSLAEQGVNDEAPAAETKRKPWSTDRYLGVEWSELEFESEQKKIPLRDEYVAKTLELLRSNPNHPKAADLYFRVGELLTQNVEAQYQVELRKYNKLVQSGDKTAKPPQQDFSRTLPYYKKILMEFTDSPNAEEVYFYFGRNALVTAAYIENTTMAAEAIGCLESFVKRFPQSRFFPKVVLMLAEHYFDNNNLARALELYKIVVDQFPTSPMADYATYKLAWVFYNYQQYEDCLAGFRKVMANQKAAGLAGSELYNQSLEDYIVAVSEAGLGWKDAEAFLKSELGETRATEEMLRIAAMMSAKDFSADAVAIYRQYILVFADNPRVVELWDRMLGAARLNYTFQDLGRVIDEMRAFFAADGAFMKAAPADARKGAEKLIAKWEIFKAERELEDGLYHQAGSVALKAAVAKLESLLQQNNGLEERILAGLVVAYAALIKEDSGGTIIWQEENLLGLSIPGDYALPKVRTEQAFNPAEAQMAALADRYLALPLKGDKPDLQPLKKVDMKSMVLQSYTVLCFSRGHFEKTLELVQAQLKHDAALPGLLKQLWMFIDSARRLGKRNVQLSFLEGLLGKPGLSKNDHREVLAYLCTVRLEEGSAMAASDPSAALDYLAKTAELCVEIPDKEAEAWYLSGEVALTAKDVFRARSAFERVLQDHKTSRFARPAQKALLKLRK